MKIESITKYRCDGCDIEATKTIGWMTLVPLASDGTYVISVGAYNPSVSLDYCPVCVASMRAHVKGANK